MFWFTDQKKSAKGKNIVPKANLAPPMPLTVTKCHYLYITAYFQLYLSTEGDAAEQKGTYQGYCTELRSFPFNDILTHINASVNEGGVLEVPMEEILHAESEVARLL